MKLPALSLSLTLLLGSQCLAADLSFEEAQTKATHDSATLNADQMVALAESQNKLITPANKACMKSLPKKPDLSDYTVIMQLDATGKVVHTWLKGTTPLALCFNQQMAGKTLFVPPTAPFYAQLDINWAN